MVGIRTVSTNNGETLRRALRSDATVSLSLMSNPSYKLDVFPWGGPWVGHSHNVEKLQSRILALAATSLEISLPIEIYEIPSCWEEIGDLVRHHSYGSCRLLQTHRGDSAKSERSGDPAAGLLPDNVA